MAYQIHEELPVGAKLATLSGESVEVLSTISTEGGQGDVYKVTCKGAICALKWYNKEPADVIGATQYHNIKKLSNMPSPSSLFIWPEVLVTENGREDSGALFGYLMRLLPDGYYELKEYLRPDNDLKAVRFRSYHAMVWAGLHMITAMRALHLKGLSYKDLNPGNVAIHPVTGHALMVDCDNISVDEDKCTVSGMRGYMAPEIVRSNFELAPTIQTDFFSEAILLFRMFYMDHPMEGRLWNKIPLTNDDTEDLLYSIKPLYNMHPTDDRNRPDEVYAPNVISRWRCLPSVLHKAFENTFVNGINHVNGRTPDNAWLATLSAARDQIIFLNREQTKEQIVRFDRKASIPAHCLRLTVRGNEVALYPMQSLFWNTISGDHLQYQRRVGWVGLSGGQLTVQNCSSQPWEVYDPVSRQTRPLAPKEVTRLVPGMRIQFEEGKVGVVDDPH